MAEPNGPAEGGAGAPAVSIVMPAYDAAATVGASIESVQAQGFGDWELIVTDDNSGDDTAAVVQGYAARDPRVRLIRHAENRRAHGARNSSIAAARGRYLAFLDSDDLWMPDKLERSLAFMRERGVDFSYTGFRRFRDDPDEPGREVVVPASTGYWGLLADNVIATSTVVIDRKAWPRVVMPENYYDDFTCWLSMLRGGGRAHGLQETLMKYRVSGGSLSGNKMKSATKVWSVFRSSEKLSLPVSGGLFALYAVNGLLKHRAVGLYRLRRLVLP